MAPSEACPLRPGAVAMSWKARVGAQQQQADGHGVQAGHAGVEETIRLEAGDTRVPRPRRRKGRGPYPVQQQLQVGGVQPALGQHRVRSWAAVTRRPSTASTERPGRALVQRREQRRPAHPAVGEPEAHSARRPAGGPPGPAPHWPRSWSRVRPSRPAGAEIIVLLARACELRWRASGCVRVSRSKADGQQPHAAGRPTEESLTRPPAAAGPAVGTPACGPLGRGGKGRSEGDGSVVA